MVSYAVGLFLSHRWKEKNIYVTYQDVSALQKNEVMQEKIDFFKSNSELITMQFQVS